MNEQAISQVISEYALEVANLRIQVATLQNALQEMEDKAKEEAEGEDK